MSLINKERTLEALRSYGKGIADANADRWTLMIAEAIVREQEEVICECDIAENAATICAVLNADADGREWKIADAEPVRHGYWKRVGHDIYECSECLQNVMTGDIIAFEFCHGCGAKMDGKEEN